MNCPRCNAEIIEGAAFCTACGSPVKNTCPACSFEMPANAKFCTNCGFALVAQPATKFAAQPVVRTLEIARKMQYGGSAGIYEVTVDGKKLGLLPVGKSYYINNLTETTKIEIDKASIISKGHMQLKLRCGNKALVRMSLDFSGNIKVEVSDATILEQNYQP